MVKIKKLGGEIYMRYPTQTNPQGLFIELDPTERVVHADYNGEIGTAIPIEVWHGTLRRYSLPSVYCKAEWINEKMEELRDLFDAVCDGYTDEWDGSNFKGVLNEEAKAAEDEIEEALYESPDPDELLQVWDPDDYFQDTYDELLEEVEEALDLGKDPEKVVLDEVDWDYVDLFDPDVEEYTEALVERLGR